MPLAGRWIVFGFLLALVCTFGLAWLVVMSQVIDPHRLDRLLVGCAWVSLNLVLVPLLYWWDKRVAKRGQGMRIPELALHSFAFAGGALGAFASRFAFRHKTRKPSFAVLTWIALGANLGLLWLALRWLNLI